MELGQLLRELRGDRTRAEVAAYMGVGTNTVSFWEAVAPQARKPPTPRNLQRLLDFYGATVSQQLLAWRLRAEAPSVQVSEVRSAPAQTPTPDEAA